MESGRILLSGKAFELTIERLCYQLIEDHEDFSEVCFIGIQPRGVLLSDRLMERMSLLFPGFQFSYGKLDITFYRDDFRTRNKPLSASVTNIDFLVENKEVILIDDVLYTGRTIHAALSAIQHFGRPANVKLLTLVDRRFNRELPVQADYVGLTVDALDDAYVKVMWKGVDEGDFIHFYPNKEN
jgi:pyrimidine operon attenuation protein / uracil phosphoribosyltransferase